MRDTIAGALTTAVKAQDKRRVSTLRLIMAAIQDRDILNRGSGKDPVTSDEISAILAKMIKQREESAKLYEEGNRLELAEQERSESRSFAVSCPSSWARTISVRPARRSSMKSVRAACVTWANA